MNPIDYFLDRQIREGAYPWQTTVATCFLLISFTFHYLLVVCINAVITSGGIYDTKFTLPDNTIIFMGQCFEYIGWLMIILCIWILLNSTQWTCDWIDRVQEKRYFRKWGEHAN